MLRCLRARTLAFLNFQEEKCMNNTSSGIISCSEVNFTLSDHVAVGKFHPCLHYNAGLDLLQVLLRDCSYVEHPVTPGDYHTFDVLIDKNPPAKKSEVAGFNFWAPQWVLASAGYKKPSVSLVHLLGHYKRFYRQLSPDIFGGYEQRLRKVADEYQFVWHIPQGQ